MARYYRIVNKDTSMVLFQINQNSTGWVPRWEEPTSDGYREIEGINYLIGRAIEFKIMHVLDNCEIQTYEKKIVPVSGSIKLATLRNRLEQKALVNKLKYG